MAMGDYLKQLGACHRQSGGDRLRQELCRGQSGGTVCSSDFCRGRSGGTILRGDQLWHDKSTYIASPDPRVGN